MRKRRTIFSFARYIVMKPLSAYRIWRVKKSFKRRNADVNITGLVVPPCGRLTLAEMEIRKHVVIIYRSPRVYDLDPNEIENLE